MVHAEVRELRRHALRFLEAAPDGEQNSRILYQQLVDYGHRITWGDFDRVVLYLERAGCLTIRRVAPEVSPVRLLRISQRGIDIVEGTLADPGILAPAQREV